MGFNVRLLRYLDFRAVGIALVLMTISLIVISANDFPADMPEGTFFTPQVKTQLKWFAMGSLLYLVCSALDYNQLREWAWLLYGICILSLVGLFFVPAIQHVHRWYRLPGLGMSIQPSEWAKLVVVLTLSWFLERRRSSSRAWSTAFLGGLIVGIPFLLILKQPDLGTAFVLFPIALVMFYFGDIKRQVLRALVGVGTALVLVVLLFFMGIVSHEQMRPYATLFLKDYQYERLNPDTHHQKAALTAIAIGGLTGTGWRQSEFTGKGWLPAPYTDSVFPAFGEEFGLVGMAFLMGLFYSLITFSFQVTAVAKDHFGRLLSAGITVYLAMQIVINMGMMCGFLPITGVPLVLVTYGGSSVLVTMTALGLLQSIYCRRFMF